MTRSTFIPLVCAALAGCAVNPPDVKEQGSGSEEAAASVAELTTGTFKLFENLNQTTGSCVLYTEISIARDATGYTARLEDRVGNFGTDVACRQVVDPKPRDYSLSYTATSCGSTLWNGSNATGTLSITDHSTRRCRDLVPSELIVTENGKRMYAAEPK